MKKKVAQKKKQQKKRTKAAAREKKPKLLIERCQKCSRWISRGYEHNCTPPTEAEVTSQLNEDLRDAWLKLRGFASELGEQRIYASSKAVMFARRVCYMFIRPKKSYIELCFFIKRPLRDPSLKELERHSTTKLAYQYRLVHEDQVEEPLTDWLREAYEAGN